MEYITKVGNYTRSKKNTQVIIAVIRSGSAGVRIVLLVNHVKGLRHDNIFCIV